MDDLFSGIDNPSREFVLWAAKLVKDANNFVPYEDTFNADYVFRRKTRSPKTIKQSLLAQSRKQKALTVTDYNVVVNRQGYLLALLKDKDYPIGFPRETTDMTLTHDEADFLIKRGLAKRAA